jgi:hypothetical protein
MSEDITHVAFDMHQDSITAAWRLPGEVIAPSPIPRRPGRRYYNANSGELAPLLTNMVGAVPASTANASGSNEHMQ